MLPRYFPPDLADNRRERTGVVKVGAVTAPVNEAWQRSLPAPFHGVVAPIRVAKKFAVETIYYPRPFAVHKPYIEVIGKENMIRLCNECPETRTIANCQVQ